MESKELIELLDSAELYPRSYSGRAMYGIECVAFTYEGSVLDAVAALLETACDTYDDVSDVRDVVELLKTASTDSMGRGVVVYFPGTKWVEEEDEEEG